MRRGGARDISQASEDANDIALMRKFRVAVSSAGYVDFTNRVCATVPFETTLGSDKRSVPLAVGREVEAEEGPPLRS
jgi:hypothetical protein